MDRKRLPIASLLSILFFIVGCSPTTAQTKKADDVVSYAGFAEIDPAKATAKDVVEMLTQVPLAFQPGTRWRYSLAIDVLGYLIEVMSGQPLDCFFKERLFDPLGMTDTDFYVPPSKANRLTALYGHPEGATELQRLKAPPDSQYLSKPAEWM